MQFLSSSQAVSALFPFPSGESSDARTANPNTHLTVPPL